LARFRPGNTLDTTALVHEAYVKLADRSRPPFNDRRHFLSVAALAMRQIVVDYARERAAQKRGGAASHVALDEMSDSPIDVDAQAMELVALDAALDRLASVDERLTRVVELRFFAGLSIDETAGVLDVSTATVKRDMRAARAFLHSEMNHSHE
jgi:RNA polymerase sigma factor (TIGR02999 family)